MTNSEQKVSTVGEILVEMMSTEPGFGFLESQNILGPFPSGAPAIFIDQVAKLGLPASIVGCVGDDDFGKVNTQRLQQDGVDISAVSTSLDRPTAVAFVRYRPDGERDFLFTLASSAATQIKTNMVEDQLANTNHLHVVGSSLAMNSVFDFVKNAIPVVKNNAGTISFDPNVRPEIMQDPQMKTRLDAVLSSCDLFLPSKGEAIQFCDAQEEGDAIQELLSRGIPEIVLKLGKDGASQHTLESNTHHSGFQVDEIDPTGAGDCFGATYVCYRRLGFSTESALKFACAAGAIAVQHQGPMEGTSTMAEIDSFIRQYQDKTSVQ